MTILSFALIALAVMFFSFALGAVAHLIAVFAALVKRGGALDIGNAFIFGIWVGIPTVIGWGFLLVGLGVIN